MLRKTLKMTPAAAILLLVLIAAPGCYERTIGARGLGADSFDVSEPYQENSSLDNWIFGEPEHTKKSRSLLNR